MGRFLTYTDRLLFERMYNAGSPKKEISAVLGFSIQTIYNEEKRGLYEHLNSDYTVSLKYSADKAQSLIDYNNTAKGQPLKLGKHYEYIEYVSHAILVDKKSPDVIVNELRSMGSFTVCTSTLYSYIDQGYITGVSNGNLWSKSRRKKRKYVKVIRHKRPPAGTSIEHRPKYISDRKTFGHWEMDLVIGKSKGKGQALLVLTERLTRYEIIIKLFDKSSCGVVSALDRLSKKFDFPAVFKSITVDNGSEFSDCYGMEHDKDGNKRTTIYYCHPYGSCEKGTCENHNKMIRRFIPKGVSMRGISQGDCNRIADYMNNLPRRVLGYKTPADLFCSKVRRCRVRKVA